MLKNLVFMLIIISSTLDAQTQEYLKYYNQIKELSSNLLSVLDSNRDRIIGIEYISASGTSESVMSRFGHSMLRFVDNDNDYTNDIVLSFEANIPSGVIDYEKGLTGAYSIYPRLDFLVNFWERYVRGENRPLERFIIPTNDIMMNALIDELVKVSKDVSMLDTYTFLNRNCAGILAQLFLNIGIITKSKGLNSRVPVLFDNWLSGSLLCTYKERKDAFQDNEYLQAKRKNYEKLILANENIIKEKK